MIECNKCEETFERNCDLEEHIGTKHETTENMIVINVKKRLY